MNNNSRLNIINLVLTASLVCILVITIIAVTCIAQTTATLTISSDPGADSFTSPALFQGCFNVSVSGTSWSGTVTLQRTYDYSDPNSAVWVDVEEFSSNIEATVDDPQRGGLYYRLGMKNGDYTSGTVYLRLTK